MTHELNAVMAIAYRDLLKFMRDRGRIIGSVIFPVVFIGALGGSLQATFGNASQINLLVFTFTGVFAQTLFQTTAFGLISLLQDRESDFTQEVFVSPISRYTIVFGKILGETLVALPQGIMVLLFALVLRIELSLPQVLALIPAGILAALLGGAFGLLLMANIGSQRVANQVFPFLFLPQFFLGGVFNPISSLPWYLDAVSHLAPLRYAVDLVRAAYYAGSPEYSLVVLDPPLFNFVAMSALFVVFLALGTLVFVRRERNR